MNIIFLKVNIALFGNPSIFAVDYESIDMKQLIFIFTVAWCCSRQPCARGAYFG